jgi:hypothetical protein
MNINVLRLSWRGFMEHATGEADDGSLRVDFDRRLRLEFQGSRITSDASWPIESWMTCSGLRGD